MIVSTLRPRPSRFGGRIPLSSHDFTLVELMVVVTTFAILTGMILPAMGKSKDRAVVTSCSGNMKQTGMAMTMYADDYDGYYVNHEASTVITWASKREGNFDSLFGDYAATQIADCPSLPTDPTGVYMGSVIIAGESVAFESMGYDDISVRRAAKSEGSDINGVGDEATNRVLAGDMMYCYDGMNTNTWTQASLGPEYSVAHRGAASNTVFEDGHVQDFRTGISFVPPSWAIWNDKWNYQGGGDYYSGHWTLMPSIGINQD